MQIYRHETSQTISGGSVSSTTLNIRGGLCRQVLVRSNTSTTVFRVSVEESGGISVLQYGYHQGELNDTGEKGALPLPMAGRYLITITNASVTDTFNVRLVVQE